MEAQLAAAVSIASAPPTSSTDPALRQQAFDYLNHLKAESQESWPAGWALWSAEAGPDDNAGRGPDGNGRKYGFNERMFGLGLVDEFLENKVQAMADPSQALSFLQQSIIQYVHDEYVLGSGDGGYVFLKNRLANTLVHLFLSAYVSTYPAFLADLVTLTTTHPPGSPSSSTPSLNLRSTDLVLRVLHELSLQLGSDVSLRAVRSRERLARDAVVRDAVRDRDVGRVGSMLWDIVRQGDERLNASSGVDSKVWTDLLVMAVQVISDFASWIDISLIVSPATLPLLYNLLNHPALPLRLASLNALTEIIGKGMKAPDKVELRRVLGISDILRGLENASQAKAGEDEDEKEARVEWREKIAKVANTDGTELVKICEEPGVDPSTLAAANDSLTAMLPLLLCLLADEYDDTSSSVFGAIGGVLGLYKKAKRRDPNNHMTPDKREFLTRLLEVVVKKMEYDEESDWHDDGAVDGAPDSDLDQEEALFAEMRKNLQTLLSSIGAIDTDLFSASLSQLILGIFSTYSTTPQSLNWRQVELAFHVLFIYGECLKNAASGPHTSSGVTYVELPPGETARSKAKASNIDFTAYPLSPLGKMILESLRSGISNFPHPSVPLGLFECLARYSDFFIDRPEAIQDALAAFLDARGLHNRHGRVRSRAYYLFYRFVRESKTRIKGEYVEGILGGMQDLLLVEIPASLPPTASPEEDPLVKAADAPGMLDSQLYLFETVGTLVHIFGTQGGDVGKQVVLLKAVTDPLLAQTSSSVSAHLSDASNLLSVLRVHHLLMALGNVAKGFPDVSPNAATPQPVWMDVFRVVTESLLEALSRLRGFKVVRQASQYAFSRFVATTGRTVLQYIPTFITNLLQDVSSAEIRDFLAFLGLVLHKYKGEIFPVLDDIFLPLIERVIYFLNQPISGTDDAVERAELQKAYLGLLVGLSGAGLQGVLLTERNQPQLQTILQSVIHYARSNDVHTCRQAFNVLNRLVIAWGGKPGDGPNGSAVPNGNGTVESTPLPGFETFIYENLVGLCFEVPAKDEFDLKDAQSQLALGEVCNLLKTIHQKRGDEAIGYLTNVYFPSIQCPSNLGQEFAQALQALDAKSFKKYFQNFIQQSRGG